MHRFALVKKNGGYNVNRMCIDKKRAPLRFPKSRDGVKVPAIGLLSTCSN